MPVNVAQIIDEFIVKDTDGSLKVWRKGELAPIGEEIGNRKLAGREEIVGREQPVAPPTSYKLQATSSVKDRVTKTPGASFYFSPHDELEVDKFRPAASQLPQSSDAIERAVKQIIEECGFTSMVPDIRGRVERIIASRFRNIRDIVSTKEVLLRPVSAGGAGCSEEQVSLVMKKIEEYKEKLERGELEEESGIRNQESGKTPPTPPLIKGRKVEFPLLTKEGSGEVIGEMQEEVSQHTRTIMSRPLSSSKKLIADVALPSSLVGPIEELQQLTIAEWRRMAGDTSERAQKVLQRINIIAEDSLTEQARAIEAWKMSPLYKLYIAIGQECMERSASVEAVVKDREGRGEQTLTVEEFEAIADLNRSLQF